jgi:hypothetical protein
MLIKKNKAIISACIAAAMSVQMVAATGISASARVVSSQTGIADNTSADRDTTIDNKYGDATYADRFMSLYDDVITRGVQNGYMSSENTVSGGLGIPYHAAEEVICEAPDYGHETTSEAMSYLVWVAAMHDNLVANSSSYLTESNYASSESTGDLAKAWKTMEVIIPSYQPGFMSKAAAGALKATYSDEWQKVEQYPTDMDSGVSGGVNPIQTNFASAYSSDTGLYLMHWLADVDNWYGFGTLETNAVASGTKSFTFINTFQRGEQESCWETVPFSCVETKQYGNSRGIKGIFSTEGNIADQYAYTNAPDAEDRAIQAVYAANRWGVGDSNVTTLAGKMGDELRNDMFDKYYKTIGAANKGGKYAEAGISGQHFLRAWYTSWGGATDGSWAWQIGASHMHEFYQNPLAAYALLEDSGLNSAMKSSGATKDYETSLVRQVELYEWLQSTDGMFAGGCTNSWNGRYESYPEGTSTFYDMGYVEHPVYADPGSNHWIGNQVWATQRLAELYYVLCQPGAKDYQLSDGSSMKDALEKMLDKWVAWFNDNTIIGTANATKHITYDYDGTASENDVPDLTQGVTDDGISFSIPSSLVWDGQPNTWDPNTGYQENTGLTCEIVGYGSGDIGCVSSLANTLIYYAAAKGVDSSFATDSSVYRSETASEAEQGLYIAKELIDRAWAQGRDEIGVSIPDTNGSLTRFWNTSVWIPTSYGEGTMPNGDLLKNGECTFYSIRTNYSKIATYQELEKYYKENGNTDDFELNYHRFWHEGDMLMALGTMATLYTDLTPSTDDEEEETTVAETDASTEESTEESTAAETEDTSNDMEESTEEDTSPTVPTASLDDPDILWGDVNVDKVVDVGDVVLLNKSIVQAATLSEQGSLNANCYYDNKLNSKDASIILQRLVMTYKQEELPIIPAE